MIERPSTEQHPIYLGVIVGFLRLGRKFDCASTGLLFAALAVGILRSEKWLSILMALIGYVEKYYAYRVALDCELFALLQRFPGDMVIFDQALSACLGRTKNADRSISSRWLGARKLLARQLAVLLLQAAALLFALLI